MVDISKPTQKSKPNPICDRSGKPEGEKLVSVEKEETSCSQEIGEKRLHKELNGLKTITLRKVTIERGNL